jgi:hypothetical protein
MSKIAKNGIGFFCCKGSPDKIAELVDIAKMYGLKPNNTQLDYTKTSDGIVFNCDSKSVECSLEHGRYWYVPHMDDGDNSYVRFDKKKFFLESKQDWLDIIKNFELYCDYKGEFKKIEDI